MRPILPFFFIVFFAISSIRVHAQINVQDSLALVDLYNHTNGSLWTNRWYFNDLVIYWKGVKVTNNRVVSIDLIDNNMVGTIPSSIGNLSELEVLGLAQNNLSGNIPASLGQLSKLQVLDLDNNQLTGTIPPALGALSSLQYLKLYSNQLSDTIPAILGSLNNLLELKLNANQLTGTIPLSLANLHNLQILWLMGNQLKGTIPPSLNQLTNLQELYLSGNQLTGTIPPSLGQLSKLTELVLGYNQLSGSIPSSLGMLSNLNNLDLSYNQLTDSIPSSLTHFNNLQQLSLNNCAFTFAGMEDMVTAYPDHFNDAVQANIPLENNNGKLSVTAGGTLANNTYYWYKGDTLLQTIVGDSVVPITGPGYFSVSVTNSIVTKSEYAYSDLFLNSDTVFVPAPPVLPDKPMSVFASREVTDITGWTNYYFDNNTPDDYSDDILVLSLQKRGQNIGTLGDGTFKVKLVATEGAGSNKGILLADSLITNPSGFWVMNRYWQVTPTKEPVSDVGVRFYYNNQDVTDINGSYPAHNLAADQLIFYKNTGGSADPTTDLAGATQIISILPVSYASDTTWTYHPLTDTTQYAEFSVAGFSGGGGGGTGNHQALPIQLLFFIVAETGSQNRLQWSTSNETNSRSFTVERSNDGIHFIAIGVVKAAGNASTGMTYSFTDGGPFANTTYYRLQLMDNSGNFTYSESRSVHKTTGFMADLYPNPVHNSLRLTFNSDKERQIQITIADEGGKTLVGKQATLGAGTSIERIEAGSLPTGLYFLECVAGEVRFRMKFVKE